jgi:hypothetical protein
MKKSLKNIAFMGAMTIFATASLSATNEEFDTYTCIVESLKKPKEIKTQINFYKTFSDLAFKNERTKELKNIFLTKFEKLVDAEKSNPTGWKGKFIRKNITVITEKLINFMEKTTSKANTKNTLDTEYSKLYNYLKNSVK